MFRCIIHFKRVNILEIIQEKKLSLIPVYSKANINLLTIDTIFCQIKKQLVIVLTFSQVFQS